MAGAKPLGVDVADPDDQHGANEVPDHFVQERRVEQRPAWAGCTLIADFAVTDGIALLIELQAPGQCGRLTIQFLIEPVAQTPDGLRNE